MIEFIDYQVTSTEINYLELKKKYLEEELKLLNDVSSTNKELINFKKRHLNLIFSWVNEIEDTDTQLLKHYYFDGMILEDIASLLSINLGVAAKKHSSIMRELNKDSVLNKFPYSELSQYNGYLIQKERIKKKEKEKKQKEYQSKYNLKRRRKNKGGENL